MATSFELKLKWECIYIDIFGYNFGDPDNTMRVVSLEF